MPLRAYFRIPAWADNATVSVNSVAWHGCLGPDFGQRQPIAGSFCMVQQDFHAGMCILIPPFIKAVFCAHACMHSLTSQVPTAVQLTGFITLLSWEWLYRGHRHP